jgi:hypothetical protein
MWHELTHNQILVQQLREKVRDLIELMKKTTAIPELASEDLLTELNELEFEVCDLQSNVIDALDMNG